MQDAVRAINADKSLSFDEKSRRIQELFQRATASTQVLSAAAPARCKHYNRYCDIDTPCCAKWYSCRLCHDEAETSHNLVRALTTLMRCRLCKLEQPIGPVCLNDKCEWKSMNYFCEKCRLWEDSQTKDIFHCDGCGICRIGKREQFWHCDRCKLCLSNEVRKETHHCVMNAADDNCVCGEHMQTSTRPVCILTCGHTIHIDCKQKMLVANSVMCPKCRKSMWRDRDLERSIKLHIKANPMPEQYRRKCEILCNDCEKKSMMSFHWLGHQCRDCRSYNTAVLHMLSADDSSNTADDEEEDVENDSHNDADVESEHDANEQ